MDPEAQQWHDNVIKPVHDDDTITVGCKAVKRNLCADSKPVYYSLH